MNDQAKELVAAVTGGRLLDIKFSLKPSSATTDEILAEAAAWVSSAEAEIAK